MYYQKSAYYHLYNRGINGDDIFFKSDNYRYLTKILSDSIEESCISIISYCLMPNHYHFLVRQESDLPVSKWVQFVFNKYVQAINKQEKRSGTLFQGKVKKKEITSERYLSEIMFYIHLNPLESNLVDRLEDWEFSNYHECIGRRTSNLWDKEFIETNFISCENYLKEINEVIDDRELFKRVNKILNHIKPSEGVKPFRR